MTSGAGHHPGATAAGRANQRLFFGVRFLSQLGQGLYLASILILAGTGANGPLGLSTIFAATLTASVIFGLPGGTLADRLGPGRGVLLGALLRLVAVAGALALSGTPGWLWVAAAAYSAGSQVFSSAEMALLVVVRRGSLMRAHGRLMALQYGGQALAALMLAALLVAGGPRAALAVSLPVYAVITVVAAVLSGRVERAARATARPVRPAFAFKETGRYFRDEPRAVYAVALLAFTDMAMKSALVAAPRYLTHDLGLSRGYVGMAVALGAVAAGIGLVGMIRSMSSHAAPRVMRYTLAGIIAALGLLITVGPLLTFAAGNQHIDLAADLGGSAVTRFVMVVPVAIVLGLCLGTAPVSARTVLSESAPHGRQAQVFATQGTIAHAAVIPPVLLAGLGTQYAGPWPTLTLIGLLGMALLIGLEALERWRGPALRVASEFVP